MRSKSSIVHFPPAGRRCKVVQHRLVEPPGAMTSAIAFSIDLRVMMSRA